MSAQHKYIFGNSTLYILFESFTVSLQKFCSMMSICPYSAFKMQLAGGSQRNSAFVDSIRVACLALITVILPFYNSIKNKFGDYICFRLCFLISLCSLMLLTDINTCYFPKFPICYCCLTGLTFICRYSFLFQWLLFVSSTESSCSLVTNSVLYNLLLLFFNLWSLFKVQKTCLDTFRQRIVYTRRR